MYGARKPKATKTRTTFGTKASVISLIDVAAWKTPTRRPMTKAVPKMGPDIVRISQKAVRKKEILASKSIS